MVGLRAFGVGVLTLFGWISTKSDHPVPVVRVNDDDSLLGEWPSDSTNCLWWNGSVQYTSDLCTHFSVARPSSSPSSARERALRCAAEFKTECVLSPEVGLAIPAAFLYNHDESSHEIMKHIIAPKILNHSSTFNYDPHSKHVRITQPDTEKTRSVVFNETVTAEYLDGLTRSLVTGTFYGPEAFCLQMLRRAFSEECWRGVD